VAEHGFSRFTPTDRRGQQVAVCECGWHSHADWRKGKAWADQIEALRRHIIGTWKAA
jgi:hypothetical protein